VITFAPAIACKYFSLELAKILHAVAAWSDVAGVAVAVLEIREEPLRAAPANGGHVTVHVQPATNRALDLVGLARYLEQTLGPSASTEISDRRLRVEWFPADYTPH